MPTIIDGYNLLHAAGILGRCRGPSELEASRSALLSFLVSSLPPKERGRTTVVFDAQYPPPLAPRILRHGGITVRFAVGYETADDLIEEMLESTKSPRDVLVVSGDHQLHQAARRCGAKAVDSDQWYASLAQRHRAVAHPPKPERPPVPLLSEDVDYWLRRFGGEAKLSQWVEGIEADVASTDVRRKLGSKKPAPGKPRRRKKDVRADDYEVSGAPRERVRPRPPVPPAKKKTERSDEPTHGRTKKRKPSPAPKPKHRPAKSDKPIPPGPRNPFPPGYGEDLLEGQDDVFDGL